MRDATIEIHSNTSNTNNFAIVVDTSVSCDGIWHCSSFSSNNCVFAVISLDNGKVLDVDPMLKFYKGCIMKNDLKQKDPSAYAQWRNSHICEFNYVGTARGMETEGAKRVFQRSIERHNLHYVEYLGNGDNKSYLSVKDVYEGLEIKKSELVGYYQMIIHTRLRKLKKKGKGLMRRDRLTDAIIDRLQNFGGVTIRQNQGNLEIMKSSLLASLIHVASKEDNNFPFAHCPTGSDSWCLFNADKVNQTNTCTPGPGLPNDVIYKIRPIYLELSKESELVKCFHGKTQKPNESFSGMICNHTVNPKFSRRKIISMTFSKIYTF